MPLGRRGRERGTGLPKSRAFEISCGVDSLLRAPKLRVSHQEGFLKEKERKKKKAAATRELDDGIGGRGERRKGGEERESSGRIKVRLL